MTQADENACLDELNSQNRLPGLFTQVARLEKADHGRRVVATGRVGAQLEIVEIAPDLSALETMLMEHPYTQEEAMGLDAETAVRQRGFTYEELIARVQVLLLLGSLMNHRSVLEVTALSANFPVCP
jgi:hypothetical protein